MAKKIIRLNENELRRLVKDKVRKEMSKANGVGDSKDADEIKSTGNISIFADPTECDPLTYDYLFNRHEGLPKEYFEPTDIPYDPNEIAMYSVPSELDDNGEECLEEGLIKTYPTAKALEYVCNELSEKGYPIKPGQFNVNNPKR